MTRSILGLLVSVALFLASSGLAWAADSPVLSRIVKNKELRVGMSADQPPLNMKSKSGEIIGLEADLAKLLADSMQVKLKVVTKPFPELLGAVEAGEVDLVMSGVTITPERNLKVAFVGPYFVSGKSILTKSKKLAGLDEATPLNSPDLKLTALENSTSQKFAQLVVPKAKLTTTKDYDSAVDLVVNGEADALIADYPICVLSVLRNPDAGLATLLTPLTIEPIGIALPADDPLLLNLVQNYLGALQATGVLEALRQKWLEDGSWLSELP